ncbi:MAG: response regulator [Chloroflexi bacterium]|nr:response regulator [Chloroflexota bacterium]
MNHPILYVEDNPQNMRLVRKMLMSAGYQVIEAFDGFSGLEAVETEHPSLILMDVNLPDIDGLEVTARIKSDPDLAAIPVVALTANAMHGDRERCLAAGCDGYIPKPITKNELLTTVAYFLNVAAKS